MTPLERWAELYERSFPRVYRALVVTLLDREAALDAIHDAFLEGLRRPPRHDANLEGWLYRVALRSARKGLRRALRWLPLERAAERATAGDIDAAIDRMEIGRLLRVLTPRQRSVVVAHYYLGLTQEEIAGLLGIRRGTVSATISQTLARLRQGESNVS